MACGVDDLHGGEVRFLGTEERFGSQAGGLRLHPLPPPGCRRKPHLGTEPAGGEAEHSQLHWKWERGQKPPLPRE